MEFHQNTGTELDPPVQSGGWFSTFVVLLAVAGIAGGLGYLYYQETQLKETNAEWEAKIERQMESIENFREKQLGGLVNAERVLDQAKNYRIEWSKVMDDVFKLESTRIQFINFSSDRNRKVTISGRGTDWSSIQALLKEIGEKGGKDYKYVKDPFISSLSRKEIKEASNSPYSNTSRTQERSEFQLSFTYVQDENKKSSQ